MDTKQFVTLNDAVKYLRGITTGLSIEECRYIVQFIGRITLRDQLAMSAISGVLANPQMAYSASNSPEKCAEWAYQYADAMLKERSREVATNPV